MYTDLPDLLTDSLEYNDIWINIKGASMMPFLKNGDSVLLRKGNHFVCADIIAFRQKGGIVLHRLIRKYKDNDSNILYQTKADKGTVLDAPIRAIDIVGKAVAIKRGFVISRLDSSVARFQAISLWSLSLLKVIIHKCQAAK